MWPVVAAVPQQADDHAPRPDQYKRDANIFALIEVACT